MLYNLLEMYCTFYWKYVVQFIGDVLTFYWKYIVQPVGDTLYILLEVYCTIYWMISYSSTNSYYGNIIVFYKYFDVIFSSQRHINCLIIIICDISGFHVVNKLNCRDISCFSRFLLVVSVKIFYICLGRMWGGIC